MKGSSGISALELVTLNKLIQKMPTSSMLFFANMFKDARYDSDSIEWEVEYGSAGLTPFVAPGSPAPSVGVDGVGAGSAKAAFYKEKMYFDEAFLNNLRLPGTHASHYKAERQLARGLQKLKNRNDRRREWMMAKAVLEGSFTYKAVGGTELTVNYGIPETHKVIKGGNDVWGGSTADIIGDVLNGKLVLSDDAGVTPDFAMLNSFLLKDLITDPAIQNLLKSSAFGNGDLFSNPAKVIGVLLDVPLKVYDEFVETEHFLTANVTGGSTTTVSVSDATDIEVGSTARLFDISQKNVWEDATITAVSLIANTFTIAAPVKSFKAGEDIVRIRNKFIKDNKFHMFSKNNGNGEPIAESMLAPFGLDRHFGQKVDKKDSWDPEGTTVRVQGKSLPVVYAPDCSYELTVK